MTQPYFYKRAHLISTDISFINSFFKASGLIINVSKCEILPLHNLNDKVISNIPVRSSVKYLGFLVTKDVTERQNLNFSSRLKKTKALLNCWSVYGRVLLSKTEGLSRSVYHSLSIYVKNFYSKDINYLFYSFIWKNKSQRLKGSY